LLAPDLIYSVGAGAAMSVDIHKPRPRLESGETIAHALEIQPGNDGLLKPALVQC